MPRCIAEPHSAGSAGCLAVYPLWLLSNHQPPICLPCPTPDPQVKHDLAKLQLTSPVCTKEGEKIALSRRVDKHWRLIGWGQIQKGLRLEL